MERRGILAIAEHTNPSGSQSHVLAYRPDVDGLRAVAVLSVIGFHASPNWFPGGYVGVDIFFVISGFLITSIICRQLDAGRFRFADFYARRCKRIFPALITVLVAVLAYGWIFLLPDEYERLGKHVGAGAGFISNFALWLESGYFDKAAESKPLLHLWSLGIEEQFYLLWPPLLVWIWKRKSDVFTVTVLIAVTSFVVNVMLVSLWQSTDMYYLPPVRFWELLLGAAFAYAHLFRKYQLDSLVKRISRLVPGAYCIGVENIQATMGLCMIVVAILVLSKATLFPGWWAVLPTVGALFLISAGPHAWINRKFLASGLLVFIGLISYPLYLWHWPLLSFAHIVQGGTPGPTSKAVEVVLAFLFAWLTYRLFEKPVRAQSNKAVRALIPSLTIAGCLGIAAYSHHIHVRAEKYGVDKIVKVAGEWGFPGHNLHSVHTEFGYHFEQGTGSPKVLFVGDSNMQQYYPRIDRLLTENPNTTKGALFITMAGCVPIPFIKGFAQAKCEGLAERALSVAENFDVDTVVIASGWVGYGVFNSTQRDQAYELLATMIAKYKSMRRQVYLVLPIPIDDGFDPYHLVTRNFFDFGFKIESRPVERAKVDAVIKPVALRLTQIAEATGAEAIDPTRFLCGEGDCPTFSDDGLPIYMDSGHLRPAFVREHITFLDETVSANKINIALGGRKQALLN